MLLLKILLRGVCSLCNHGFPKRSAWGHLSTCRQLHSALSCSVLQLQEKKNLKTLFHRLACQCGSSVQAMGTLQKIRLRGRRKSHFASRLGSWVAPVVTATQGECRLVSSSQTMQPPGHGALERMLCDAHQLALCFQQQGQKPSELLRHQWKWLRQWRQQ